MITNTWLTRLANHVFSKELLKLVYCTELQPCTMQNYFGSTTLDYWNLEWCGCKPDREQCLQRFSWFSPSKASLLQLLITAANILLKLATLRCCKNVWQLEHKHLYLVYHIFIIICNSSIPGQAGFSLVGKMGCEGEASSPNTSASPRQNFNGYLKDYLLSVILLLRLHQTQFQRIWNSNFFLTWHAHRLLCTMLYTCSTLPKLKILERSKPCRDVFGDSLLTKIPSWMFTVELTFHAVSCAVFFICV